MFELRSRLIEDFREYVQSFINISDERIRAFFEGELDRGVLWPEPLLQLNPLFRHGKLVDELIANGQLDPRCGTIFRFGKTDANAAGKPMSLYVHQLRALESAQAGRSYVLTTGTGSGKSLSFIVPIVNAILKAGSGKGIRAVVVYPMNALANSQIGELDKYLKTGFSESPVSYARYTGQEGTDERDRITANPPDILLTNYMMLELMLTRPYERKLVEALGGLKFVVLDELHTYRGRQGADVAMLMRRLRQASGSDGIQFIGTSATMATDGSAAEKRALVAGVAGKIFGVPVLPDDVIGETIDPFTDETETESDQFRKELERSLQEPNPTTLDSFRASPLTVWLERAVGLTRDDEGSFIRARPQPLFGEDGIAGLLSAETSATLEVVEGALVRHLEAGSRLNIDSGPRPFVFRLHQFVSPGIGVFATLGSSDERILSLEGQKSAPGEAEKLFFPLCFCRSCGQSYYTLAKTIQEGGERFVPRQFNDRAKTEDSVPGYFIVPNPDQVIDLDALVPEDWKEDYRSGRRVKGHKKKFLPTPITTSVDGQVGGPVDGWFVPFPFSICLACGESYLPREAELGKLSILGMQGRSTATTTLALSTLGYLRNSDAPAQKLLSFTDNRQDASLQAGHLNDFIEVGTLRAGIYAAALAAGSEGVTHDKITVAVEKELKLDQRDYAGQPSQLPTQVARQRQALRDVLGYRIYRDLRRGWRVNAPNLEQVGLLQISYPDLDYVCSELSLWQGKHQVLVSASHNLRQKITLELLERLRKRLAIHVDFLDPTHQDGIKQRSNQLLKEPWGLSDDESIRMDGSTFAWLQAGASSDERADIVLSGKSGFAVWLRQDSVLGSDFGKLSQAETEAIIADLVSVLTAAGLLRETSFRSGSAYQLNAEVMTWLATEPGDAHRRTRNSFFERFYKERAVQLRGVHAREHTAQVASDEREKREQAFREGTLPIMFCSPTMELGVDISDLSVVNLRNVPPTPANYAQRSGRAGRSGQPALVYTYCTGGSPHDQYYFRRPDQMVSGAVAPPRLDVANEDLVRAHVHAVWLAEADLDLGRSLADKILDVSGDEPTLKLRPEVKDKLDDQTIRERARVRATRMLQAISDELATTNWFTNRWLDDEIRKVTLAFDSACDRWRNLYKAARGQYFESVKKIADHSASQIERDRAGRLQREAQQQMDLLTDGASERQGDFYAYRYLASEGFLPGYNFPRLPLSAYIPKQRGRDEYLSRPRFLAIAEFGPGAVVYHEGSRYLVERVIMPASARREGGLIATQVAKLCTKCGYLHDGDHALSNLCQHCGEQLEASAETNNLFRLEAVSLRRRDRITCDEEERMRQGYDLRTAIRFGDRPDEDQCLRCDAVSESGQRIAELVYAQAATIWRVNFGWNRRKNENEIGFELDVERARWIPSEQAQTLRAETPDEPARRVMRVVPFVEDRRNALMFRWVGSEATAEQMAGLQAALKSAIQAVFQLEDSELAAEPLPSSDDRRFLLFYEAAEGGAGVLRRLVEDPGAMRLVARKALELCHYDADDLTDLGRGPRAREDCSTACYDCLLSYGNQRDHLLLDRRLMPEMLSSLRDAKFETSTGTKSRSQKLDDLIGQCDSELERKWLRLVYENNLTLPSYAQYRIQECGTRPDFVYVHGANKLAVYIDGPPHDYPARQMRDAEQDIALLGKGWAVQRFHHESDWMALFSTFPGIYGGQA